MGRFCQNCGVAQNENAVTCWKCGAQLSAPVFQTQDIPGFVNSSQQSTLQYNSSMQMQPSSPGFNVASQPNFSFAATKKKNRLPLILGIVFGMLAIIVGIVLAFLFLNKKDVAYFRAEEMEDVLDLVATAIEIDDTYYVKGLLPTYSEETAAGKTRATEQKRNNRSIDSAYAAMYTFSQILAGQDFLVECVVKDTLEAESDDYSSYRGLYADFEGAGTITFTTNITNAKGRLVHQQEGTLELIKQDGYWVVSDYNELLQIVG